MRNNSFNFHNYFIKVTQITLRFSTTNFFKTNHTKTNVPFVHKKQKQYDGVKIGIHAEYFAVDTWDEIRGCSYGDTYKWF